MGRIFRRPLCSTCVPPCRGGLDLTLDDCRSVMQRRKIGAMLYTRCTYEDYRAPIIIEDSDIPTDRGAYAYECPICRRGIRFGVVSRFTPISPRGEARGPNATE